MGTCKTTAPGPGVAFTAAVFMAQEGEDSDVDEEARLGLLGGDSRPNLMKEQGAGSWIQQVMVAQKSIPKNWSCTGH